MHVIVGRMHIHSTLDSIFVLADVLLTPHKLIYFGLRLVLSGVFESPFCKAVQFAAGCSWGLLTSGINVSFFLEGGFQSDDC